MPDQLQYVLSNGSLPPLPDWQAAVDRWTPLIPFELLEVRPGADGGCVAQVRGRAISFTCEPAPVSRVAGGLHHYLSQQWRFAYGFRGTGGWLAGASSAVALIGYALATSGVRYHPDVGTCDDFQTGRNEIDAVFAHEFDAVVLYRARYPEEFEEREYGPAYVSSRVL